MFRIMLLLCYSLIDINTIPFYFSTVSDRKSRATHSTARCYRIVSSYTPYSTTAIPWAPSRPSVSPCRMGRITASTSLMTQHVQAVIRPQHVVIFCFYTNKQKAMKIILK